MVRAERKLSRSRTASSLGGGAVELLAQLRLVVRSVVLVDHALGRRLVVGTARCEEGSLRRGTVAGRERFAELARLRLQGGNGRLVALARLFVREDALLLGLDIGHRRGILAGGL